MFGDELFKQSGHGGIQVLHLIFRVEVEEQDFALSSDMIVDDTESASLAPTGASPAQLAQAAAARDDLRRTQAAPSNEAAKPSTRHHRPEASDFVQSEETR